MRAWDSHHGKLFYIASLHRIYFSRKMDVHRGTVGAGKACDPLKVLDLHSSSPKVPKQSWTGKKKESKRGFEISIRTCGTDCWTSELVYKLYQLPVRGWSNLHKVKISEVLEKIGDQVGLSVTGGQFSEQHRWKILFSNSCLVALAWATQKYPYVFPIIGGRKVEHLEDNIKSLTVSLSEEQIKEIESVVPFEWGFPMDTFGRDPALTGVPNVLMVSYVLHTHLREAK
jgi:hypothetical protein